MTSALKQIYQEIVQINKKSVFDDEAQINIPNADNPLQLEVTLTPKTGVYQGGRFVFKVVLPDTYPNKAPSITCQTKIHHPNVSYTGTICLNILSGEFNSSYRLEHYINALLWLLLNPNFDSQLNGSVKKTTYEMDVYLSIRGFPVAGTSFERVFTGTDENMMDEQLKKKLYGFLWTAVSSKKLDVTIEEFLNDPMVTDWVKHSACLRRMKELGLQGKFLNKKVLSLVPDEVIVKTVALKVGEDNVLVLFVEIENKQVLSKELLAKFLNTPEDNIKQIADSELETSVGCPKDTLSAFGTLDKFTKIIVDTAIMEQPLVVVPSGVEPLMLIKSSFLGCMKEAVIAPVTGPTFANTPIGTSDAVFNSNGNNDNNRPAPKKKNLFGNWLAELQRLKASTQISLKDFLESPVVSPWLSYEPALKVFTDFQVDGRFIPTNTSAHKAGTRSKQCKVEVQKVLKELIWLVDGQPVLILSNGKDKLDVDMVAKALNTNADDITIPLRSSIENLCGCQWNCVSLFSPLLKVSKILINERVLKEDVIVTSAGISSMQIQISPEILKKVGSPIFAPLVNQNAVPANDVPDFEEETHKNYCVHVDLKNHFPEFKNTSNNNNNSTIESNTVEYAQAQVVSLRTSTSSLQSCATEETTNNNDEPLFVNFVEL